MPIYLKGSTARCIEHMNEGSYFFAAVGNSYFFSSCLLAIDI